MTRYKGGCARTIAKGIFILQTLMMAGLVYVAVDNHFFDDIDSLFDMVSGGGDEEFPREHHPSVDEPEDDHGEKSAHSKIGLKAFILIFEAFACLILFLFQYFFWMAFGFGGPNPKSSSG